MSELLRVYREAARRAIPIEVLIELTHHCNFRCRHCYIPDFAAPDRLSTARLLALLDELAGMGTLVVALSGGELFLRRDWLTIARRARELAFDLHLFTNGSLIGDEEADRIRELDATAQISFYSTDETRFDDLTARPGSYQRVRGGIERLRARDVRVVLKVPLTTLNYRDLPAIEAYATAIGATCRSSPFITHKKDGDLGPLALRVPSAELVRELGGPVLGCHDERTPDPEAPLCAAASRYACVTSSGEVMACNILPGSGGSLRLRSFREIWESSPWLAQVRAARQRDLHACAGCERLSYCGRCPAQALVEDGDLFGPSAAARERAELIERHRDGSASSTDVAASATAAARADVGGARLVGDGRSVGSSPS